MRDDRRKAVALEYSRRANAPAVIAKARGALVEKLLQIAESRDIPIYRDADLAEVLIHVPARGEIGAELYAAVAEVLAYCYRVNARFKTKMQETEN